MAKNLQNIPDSELLQVGKQATTVAAANPATYGTTAGVIAALTGLGTTFHTSVDDKTAKAAASKAATTQKNADRTPYEKGLASMRDVAEAHGTSQADMDALGLPQGGTSAPTTVTIPAASVDTSQRLRHTISWTEASTPDTKRKPRGTMGADIYIKIDGPPPTDPKECTFLTTDSQTPYEVIFDGEDAGKMAHYMLRWRMTDGTTGPWSETISATITG